MQILMIYEFYVILIIIKNIISIHFLNKMTISILRQARKTTTL